MTNEFKKINSTGETRFVLEFADGGATSSASIASVEKPLGELQRRAEPPKPRNFVAKNAKMGGAGQHKDKKKAEKQGDVKHKNKQFSEGEVVPLGKKHRGDLGDIHSCPKCGGELQGGNYMGQRVKVCQPCKQVYLSPNSGIDQQGNKTNEQGVAEDHEIQMASSELQSIAKNAQALLHMVRKYSEQEGLDAWQQSKITKAADYLNAVLQSVSGEQNPLEGVGVPSYGVGGARNRGDDERHDLDDYELQQNRQEVTSYNITVDGKPINPKPIFGRSAAIKWGKEQSAAGVDLSNAMISPVQYTEDAYMESLVNMLERSVSQAQHNLMVGVAHNPAFAQKVKVKRSVGQEFANADQGHDISKLPMRVPKKK